MRCPMADIVPPLDSLFLIEAKRCAELGGQFLLCRWGTDDVSRRPPDATGLSMPSVAGLAFVKAAAHSGQALAATAPKNAIPALSEGGLNCAHKPLSKSDIHTMRCPTRCLFQVARALRIEGGFATHRPRDADNRCALNRR